MRYSTEEKKKLFEGWRTSGMSAWCYAKAKGLSPQTFAKWTRTEREEKRKSGFVEIHEHEKTLVTNPQEIAIEKDGLIIRVPLSGTKELQTILAALGIKQ